MKLKRITNEMKTSHVAPIGTYKGTITSISDKPTREGKPMVTFNIEIVDTKTGQVYIIPLRCMPDYKFGQVIIDRVLKQCGVSESCEEWELVGKEIELEIGHKEYNDSIQAYVSKVY